MTTPDDQKCVWCNGSEGELRTITAVATDRLGRNPREREFVVHPRHAESTRSFLRFVARSSTVFLVGMAAWTVVAMGLAVAVILLEDAGRDAELWARRLLGPYGVLLGAFILRYPFCTPETVRWLGLGRAKLLAQATGWVLVAAGVWFLAGAL